MAEALFIATERFDPSDGEKWQQYFDWAKIPVLAEVVSLDHMLCRRIPADLSDEDFDHTIFDDLGLDYFRDLDYLLNRVGNVKRRNILGIYMNPELHIDEPPASGGFQLMGYDLNEKRGWISALTNCGGFPDVFSNEELNRCGLISGFNRAREVTRDLAALHPEDPHAQCDLYAIWRLNETSLTQAFKSEKKAN